jgi:hypothetical protein
VLRCVLVHGHDGRFLVRLDAPSFELLYFLVRKQQSFFLSRVFSDTFVLFHHVTICNPRVDEDVVPTDHNLLFPVFFFLLKHLHCIVADFISRLKHRLKVFLRAKRWLRSDIAEEGRFLVRQRVLDRAQTCFYLRNLLYVRNAQRFEHTLRWLTG